MQGGHACQGNVHDRGHAWWGMHGSGGAWQGGCVYSKGVCVAGVWPLQRMVRILLECILVISFFMFILLLRDNFVVLFKMNKTVFKMFLLVIATKQFLPCLQLFTHEALKKALLLLRKNV